ncbi:LLM class flavin-dependent oxidoreductase [Rubrobacter marinus]|uniref:LLM class flavin-dependent oxidoreductase n=1 Tax=Rubrobacter marinus TaxID=2653852 RepID=UPI001A9F9E22|nr:LLM class flavin-dependent oxidoreductase [Rubrobacter marinus]
MLEVALMIEGQNGIDWPSWQRLGRAAEDLGLAALYRSDHSTNPTGPYLDALELWFSLTWLAANTERIGFGPLVSPVTFRHPVVTAWQASRWTVWPAGGWPPLGGWGGAGHAAVAGGGQRGLLGGHVPLCPAATVAPAPSLAAPYAPLRRRTGT